MIVCTTYKATIWFSWGFLSFFRPRVFSVRGYGKYEVANKRRQVDNDDKIGRELTRGWL